MKELNLSLLSRGCGQEIKEKVTDVHGRIEVYYEPEDYFNWVSQRHFFRLRKIENERGPLRPPVYMAEPVPPRTFSTRKGPLILYSEELALSTWTLANADRRGRGPQAMEDKDKQELNTLRDLTGAILAYGNKQAGHRDIRSFFQFLGPPEENADRQVRPGYSAKRYLACLSQTWDPTNVQKIRAGALGDVPPMPEGAPSTLPHYRGQHDLSSAPRPYKVLPSIPTTLETLPEGHPIWDSTSPPETHDDPKGRNEMPTERTKKNVEYQILIPVPCSELSPIPEARPGTEAENRDPENVIIRLSPVKSIKEEEEEEETPAQALRAAMACISIDASWLQSEAHSTSEEGTPQKAPVPPPVPPEQRADAQDQFLPSILPTFLLDVSPPRMPERKPLRLPRLAEPSGTKRRCEEVELPKELLILPLLQLKGIGLDGDLGLADLLDNENKNEVETGEPPNRKEQSEERLPGPPAEDKTQKKLLGSLQKFGLPTSGQDSEACEGQESTDPQLPPKSFLEILPPIVSKKGPRNQSSLAFLKARLKENRDMEDGIIRGVLPFEIREYYKSGSVGSIIMGPDGRIVHLSLLGSLTDKGKDLSEESQEHNGDELRGIPGISMAPGSTVFLPQEKGFRLVDYNLEQHERSALHLFDSMCQDQNTQDRDEGGQTLTTSHKGSGLPVVDTWQDSAFVQKGQRGAGKSNNTASLGGQRGSGPSSNQQGGTTAALASGRDGTSLPPVLKVKRRMGFDMLKQPGDADLQNMRDPRPPVAGASPLESWKHPETSGGPESPHLGSTAARHPGDPQAGHHRLGPLVDTAGQASASNSMLRNSGQTMDIHPEGTLDGSTEDGRAQHPQVGAASHQRALGKSKKGSDLKGRARFLVGKPKEKRPEDKSQAAGTTAKTAKHQRGHKRRRKVGPAEDGQGQDEEVSSAGQKDHSGKKTPRKGGLDIEEAEKKKEEDEEEKEKGSTKQAAGRGQQGTKKEVADETAHMSFSRTSEQLRKQDNDKEDEEEEEEEEEEEADFTIYKRELDSSENKNLKARQAQAALDRNRPTSLVTSGPASHLETPRTPAVPTELLAVRDAERADNAEKRRQEVERKRREREELRKRMEQEKQEQHEREDRMKQELEEDERRRAEEMQLKKLQQEAEQQQQEEQERMRQRLQAAAQERERRAQEEHRRKLLLLQKLRRQEEEQRAAEAARRQAEEEARRAEEARRMQEMSDLERLEYQRWKREEEERRRQEEEERQRVAAERMQRVLEEAKWQALLLARQRAVLEQQLIFQRDLLVEADGMERAQEISRPWVYSYFELLEMLGLPLPAEGVQKEA